MKSIMRLSPWDYKRLSNRATFVYGSRNRLLSTTDPPGKIEANTYDANGRVATQTQADGTTYQFAYTLDGNGKVTQTDMTDPRGYVKRLTFNSLGYTLTSTDAYGQPEAQTTTYEWQAGTNLLVSVTDALARKRPTPMMRRATCSRSRAWPPRRTPSRRR